MDSTINGAIIGAVATVIAAIIGFLALRKTSPKHPVAEVLPDRLAVYKRATQMIESAKRSVIDTTWGNSEENLLLVETEALNDYLQVKSRVIARSKVIYREIYTEVTHDNDRAERIEAERICKERPDNYCAKLLEGLSPSFPMVDLLVIDGEKVVLSCLSKDIAKSDHHHLYLESIELAAFLTQYFQICWDKARLLRDATPDVGGSGTMPLRPALHER